MGVKKSHSLGKKTERREKSVAPEPLKAAANVQLGEGVKNPVRRLCTNSFEMFRRRSKRGRLEL